MAKLGTRDVPDIPLDQMVTKNNEDFSEPESETTPSTDEPQDTRLGTRTSTTQEETTDE
jgi:hypothetical protein